MRVSRRRTEPRVATLQDEADAAGGRVVVVALENGAQGGGTLLVAVAEIADENGDDRTVRVHFGQKPADPHKAVVAFLAGVPCLNARRPNRCAGPGGRVRV